MCRSEGGEDGEFITWGNGEILGEGVWARKAGVRAESSKISINLQKRGKSRRHQFWREELNG